MAIDKEANQVADPCWEEMVATGRLGGRTVRWLARTESTNTVALAMGREGAPAGTLVVVEAQSRGRGRLGRAWMSPPGTGIYCSMILRPRLAGGELARITLAAGLAVCRALEANTDLRPGLKWPNDVWLNGRKCGGILTETGPLGEGRPLVVVGVGLNVNTPLSAFPEDLREKVTSLAAASGRGYRRGPLLAAMADELEAAVARLEAGDFGGILNEWRQRDAIAGKALEWLTPAGEVVRGVALGPDDEGVLHIRDAAGREHEVLSGDLSLIKP